jgi:hypothetical protein
MQIRSEPPKAPHRLRVAVGRHRYPMLPAPHIYPRRMEVDLFQQRRLLVPPQAFRLRLGSGLYVPLGFAFLPHITPRPQRCARSLEKHLSAPGNTTSAGVAKGSLMFSFP